MPNDENNAGIIPLHRTKTASRSSSQSIINETPESMTPKNPTAIVHTHSDIGAALARHETVADASSLASLDRPPGADDSLPPSKIYHPLSFPVLALLMPASVFGVLTRLGLQALATYQGQSIFPLAYAQAFGCFVMGFTLQFKEPIGQFYGPLYTAITTGFCGSVTTFSGWELDVFSSWVNATQAHRGGLRDVVDGLTKTIFTLIISLSSMSFGAHVGSLLRPYAPKRRLPRRPIRYTFSAVAVLIYAATLPAYFRLSADYRHQATAALLFSFPGTLTRYLLSYHLNPRLKRFPLGTYTANSLGTAFLGAFHVLQSVTTPLSLGSCAILQGLADGYCGCLTTVSTFAAEVDASRDASGYFYVALSWGTGQLLLLLILGSSYWAGHISEQVTCRYA